MIPESLRSFVSRLRRETELGTIRWAVGSEDSFFCNQGKYTVHVSFTFDEDRELSVYRMLLAAEGRDAGFVVNSDESDVQDMRDLYASASLSAAGFRNMEAEFFGG